MTGGADEGALQLVWQACGGTSDKGCWKALWIFVQQMLETYFLMCVFFYFSVWSTAEDVKTHTNNKGEATVNVCLWELVAVWRL